MSKNRNDDVERLAAAFAALANPQRLRMFVRLASSCCASATLPDGPAGAGSCRATEAGDGLDLAASTVSHHLKELRQAGLVHVERRGRRVDCWASQEMLDLLGSFFARWARTAQRRRARRHAGAPPVLARGGPR